MFSLTINILKIIRFLIIIIEFLFINNIYILCSIIDKLTLHIRHEFFDTLLPEQIKKIKHDHNSFYVHMHCFLLISPEYLINRFWLIICDYISYLVPNMNNISTLNTFIIGTLGMIGINGIEVFDTDNKESIITEKFNKNFLIYKIKNDKLLVDKFSSNMNDNINANLLNNDLLRNHTKTLLSDNINKLSFINSKIYSIASQTLKFNNPVLILIRELCCETLYDRTVFSGLKPLENTDLDLSTLHKFTRCFIMENELISNFHFYKYCHQMQSILDIFVRNFCKKNSEYILNNNNIELFTNIVNHVFVYTNENDSDENHKLNIEDILIAVIFNIIEYSMNRNFIEIYWKYQRYFPYCDKNNKIYNVISKIHYSEFIPLRLKELVGEQNRLYLLHSMYTLYVKFKNDNVAFVECINPYNMKKSVLTI